MGRRFPISSERAGRYVFRQRGQPKQPERVAHCLARAMCRFTTRRLVSLFKEVGQRPDFQPCLEHDFIGANARARRIDERCAKEFPVRAVKRPAIRIATAVLMYSFGGLRREGGGESEMPPPGISEPELLAICVTYLDSTPVLACLKEWFGPSRKRIFIVRNRR